MKVYPATKGARAPSSQIPHSCVPAFPDMILPLISLAVRYSLSNHVSFSDQSNVHCARVVKSKIEDPWLKGCQDFVQMKGLQK